MFICDSLIIDPLWYILPLWESIPLYNVRTVVLRLTANHTRTEHDLEFACHVNSVYPEYSCENDLLA